MVKQKQWPCTTAILHAALQNLQTLNSLYIRHFSMDWPEILHSDTLRGKRSCDQVNYARLQLNVNKFVHTKVDHECGLAQPQLVTIPLQRTKETVCAKLLCIKQVGLTLELEYLLGFKFRKLKKLTYNFDHSVYICCYTVFFCLFISLFNCIVIFCFRWYGTV